MPSQRNQKFLTFSYKALHFKLHTKKQQENIEPLCSVLCRSGDHHLEVVLVLKQVSTKIGRKTPPENTVAKKHDCNYQAHDVV